ncbi:hypothetical protein FRC01_005129, partial [Tulasnella sp. 417]
MDDDHFDQDYTASRYTQLQLSASLHPRQLSNRPRNPSHQNGLGGPATDEDLEEHLSPREFLPSLPFDSCSPRPGTNRSLASVLRDPNVGEHLRLRPFQLPQSQQSLPPFPLRPAEVVRAPLDSASDTALTTRAVNRTLDIRGGLAPTSNPSTPAWPSPGGAQEQSPYGSPRSQAVAMISDHNLDVLARPSKKSKTTKSTHDNSHQIYHHKPPSQLGHYAGEAQSFVKTFKLIACALLLAKNPFPNPAQRREMFEEAWDRAEKEQPLRGSAVGLKLNDNLMVLASDAQRTFRNRLKREAENAVNDMGDIFGIVPKNTIPKPDANPVGHATAVQNNVQVSSLGRTNANLIFLQWRNPDQPRLGPFKNPAIERVLLAAFRSADAEGAKGFYLFEDRMPGEAIALACAAIDVCLEEYSQGVHKRIDFTTTSHRVTWEFYRNEWARLRDRDLTAQDYIERLQSDISRKAA